MASFAFLSRHGFRRWYERQLIEAHLWLVSCFLAIILATTGIELLAPEHGGHLPGFLAMVVGFVLALHSWRRYSGKLALTERWANKGTVPFARLMRNARSSGASWSHLRPRTTRMAEPSRRLGLLAHCRQCGRQWTL